MLSNNTKQLFSTWLLLLLVSIFAPFVSSNTWAESSLPPLRLGVGSERQYPPHSWYPRCTSNHAQGVLFDIAYRALTNLGIDYQIEPLTSPHNDPTSIQKLLADNVFDATFMIGNEVASSFIVVTEPVVVFSTALFVRSDRQVELSTLESLRNQRGSYITDAPSLAMRALTRKYPDTFNRLDHNPSLDQVSQRLLTGETVYFITGRSVGSAFLSERGLSNKIARTDLLPITEFSLHMIIRKESHYASQAEALSREFSRMHNSGEATLLLRKNMLLWLSNKEATCPDKK